MATSAKASQKFVPVKEVRGGTIILKDGGLRAVLMASSINLSLKSADEQRAIIAQFQAFLNSLDFSVQITIQSRKLDIRPYLKTLEDREKEITEELLKIQTREYMNFIREFTESVNIMTKNFFIVVPYNAAPLSADKGLVGSLLGSRAQQNSAASRTEEFEEKRTQLDQRVGVVVQGLARIGIRTVELGTEEAVEMLYKAFNLGETDDIGGRVEADGSFKQ